MTDLERIKASLERARKFDQNAVHKAAPNSIDLGSDFEHGAYWQHSQIKPLIDVIEKLAEKLDRISNFRPMQEPGCGSSDWAMSNHKSMIAEDGLKEALNILEGKK